MSNETHDVHAVTVAGGTIGQIQSQGLDPGIQDLIATGSGQVHRPFTANVSQRPTMQFTTEAIETALGVVDLPGAPISAANPLVFYLKKVIEAGLRSSSSDNIKVSADEGIVYPTRITAETGDGGTSRYALIEYMAHIVESAGDGTSPIVVTTAQALAGTVNHDEAFVLGDSIVNGTTLDNILGIEIDTGITPWIIGGSGKIFATSASIQKVHPIIRIRALDGDVLSLISMLGAAITTATVDLRAVDKNTDVNYTEGLRFTMGDGLAKIAAYEGAHGRPGEHALELIPTEDSGNAPIIWATFAPA